MMKYALLFSLLLTVSAYAEKTYGSAVVDSIISVYDGDTFRCNVRGYPPLIGENISIRVRGIDTPEIRGKCDTEKVLAKMIRDTVKVWLTSADQIILKDVARPKYFRLLATVLIDGVDLKDKLIIAGFAKLYDGGTKESWCK